MPVVTDSEVLLVKQLTIDFAAALAALTLTNTDVTFVEKAYYERAEAAQAAGKAYAIFDIPVSVEGDATGRLKRSDRYTVTVTAWAPDAGSPLEILKAIAEYETVRVAGTGKPSRPVVTGFTLIRCDKSASRKVEPEGPDAEGKAFGRILELDIELLPT